MELGTVIFWLLVVGVIAAAISYAATYRGVRRFIEQTEGDRARQ